MVLIYVLSSYCFDMCVRVVMYFVCFLCYEVVVFDFRELGEFVLLRFC